MPLVEQELLTLPEHLSSTPVFSGVRYLIFSFMCMFCRSLFVLLSFCTFFLWPLRCCSLLWYTDSDYPFGISSNSSSPPDNILNIKTYYSMICHLCRHCFILYCCELNSNCTKKERICDIYPFHYFNNFFIVFTHER